MLRFVVVVTSALAILSAGCSHSVIIDSEPTGAEIKVNGEKVGIAPVTYSETTGWEKVYDIQADKPGYKTTRKQVKQTEWNAPVTVATGIGAFACIYFLGFPPIIGLLWARQMPDRVVVNLEKPAGQTGGDGVAAPPSSYGY